MLTLENITKKYGKVTALDGVSLEFGRGIYALLGPNGSGKTTMMSLICGLLAPTEGRILFDGGEIKALGASYRARLGYMPQYPGMYPNFTVLDFLYYLSELKGLKGNDGEIAYLLRCLELDDVAQRRVRALSGGMKQRLALCGALLGSPEIIILDEPTAGLDPAQRVAVKRLISEIAAEKTVIWATHIVSDIENIAREIIFLKKGRVIEKSAPDSRVEARYMELYGDEA